jgi:hypothetical protein
MIMNADIKTYPSNQNYYRQMKLGRLLKKRPDFELELADVAFRYWKIGECIGVADVEGIAKDYGVELTDRQVQTLAQWYQL